MMLETSSLANIDVFILSKQCMEKGTSDVRLSIMEWTVVHRTTRAHVSKILHPQSAYHLKHRMIFLARPLGKHLKLKTQVLGTTCIQGSWGTSSKACKSDSSMVSLVSMASHHFLA